MLFGVKSRRVGTWWSLTLKMARACRCSGSKGAPGNAVDDVTLLCLLLQLGSDPKITNDKKWIPLMMAAGMGTGANADSVVNYLDSHGADIRIWSKPTRNGRTPLWIVQGNVILAGKGISDER